jgi:hypothetical protein
MGVLIAGQAFTHSFVFGIYPNEINQSTKTQQRSSSFHLVSNEIFFPPTNMGTTISSTLNLLVLSRDHRTTTNTGGVAETPNIPRGANWPRTTCNVENPTSASHFLRPLGEVLSRRKEILRARAGAEKATLHKTACQHTTPG